MTKYLSEMQGAFADLPRAEQTDNKKIRTLMSTLRDPKLEPAKAAILANGHLQENFGETINFLTSYKSQTDSVSQAGTRNLLPLDTGGRGGRGGRGRGRGGGGRGGRGRGRGRGGRGGRGRGRSKAATRFDPNNPTQLLTYDAWKNLTTAQMRPTISYSSINAKSCPQGAS